MALMADDGLARAINPAHTPADGDTVFALATGRWDGQVDVGTIGALAAEALSEAIVRAATQATASGGLPSARTEHRASETSVVQDSNAKCKYWETPLPVCILTFAFCLTDVSSSNPSRPLLLHHRRARDLDFASGARQQ
jgi:hypothetical protein